MPVPAVQQSSNPVDLVLTRLHESHELSVYESIDRLVRAGEEIGLDAHSLVRMLDRGMSLEQLLEMIEAQMECLQLRTRRAEETSRAA
jgi:hypothetical protein